MKTRLLSLIAVFVLVASIGSAQEKPKIVIAYSAPHPLVAEVVNAFKAEVTKTFPDAVFIEKHANGNPAEFGSTVLKSIAERPALLAPISTPLTKIAVDQARGKIPVVFMAVTDPVGAGVADSMDRPGKATGSSDVCPYGVLLGIARQFMPNAKKLGAPYNPNDQPAVFGLEQFKKRSGAFGFEIIARQIPSRDELSTEVRGVASLSDAILLGSDNLLMENPDLVARAAAAAGRPVFACDSASVEKGAVAGVSIRYADIGTEAGKLAVRVLKGEAAGSLPVAVLSEGNVSVNARAACQAGLKIPTALAATASIIEKDYKCPEKAAVAPTTTAQPKGTNLTWVWVLIAVVVLAGAVWFFRR